MNALAPGFSGCLATSLLITIAGAGPVRTVVLTGDPAPGADPGTEFVSLSPPVLNNNGRTAFRAVLTGSDESIWSEAGGALGLVALERDIAPGTSARFSSFSTRPLFNDLDQTAFNGALFGIGVNANNDGGVWSEGGGGGLGLVAREGDVAPGGSPTTVFFTIAPAVMNNSGQTAFAAVLAGVGVGAANNTGVWSEGGGAGLQLVAREGSPAPSTPAGVVFDDLSFPTRSDPVLNDNGQVAFRAPIMGPSVPTTQGLWSEGGGAGLAPVALGGDNAPGTGPGVDFLGFSRPSINNNGHTVFPVSLQGANVNTDNNSGIWSEGAGGGLAPFAQEGSNAPGTGGGVDFAGFVDVSSINGSGQAAFLATLTGTGVVGTNDAGIWSDGNGLGVALVAREGDNAPGAAPGVNFVNFGDVVINNNGQTAFTSELIGPGVNLTNNKGLWAEDANGDLHLIARTGDQIDVSDDPLSPDLRTIATLNFVGNSGNEDGRSNGFNDRGQVAFVASFTDLSAGVFVSDLVADLGLLGDYSDDGVVDAADYTLWRDTEGQTGAGLPADGDGSGEIDSDDYDIWAANFGETDPPPSTAIPEPSGLMLAIISAPLACRARFSAKR